MVHMPIIIHLKHTSNYGVGKYLGRHSMHLSLRIHVLGMSQYDHACASEYKYDYDYDHGCEFCMMKYEYEF